MTLGERIVKTRKELGITQKGLAEILNISPTRLNYWEKDKREPDAMNITALAKALNVTGNYLLGLEDDNSSGFANELKQDEIELIKKYRTLLPGSKDLVLTVMDYEVAHPRQTAVNPDYGSDELIASRRKKAAQEDAQQAE